jgi:hypothetical protein
MEDMPHDDEEAMQEIRGTLKSTRRPYRRFQGYYRLEDVIEQYMHIWFEEPTSSD